MMMTRKIKLTIVEDEEIRKQWFDFIRDSQYAQYKGLNILMGYLSSVYYKNDMQLNSEEFKLAKKNITNSSPLLKDIDFGKGIDSKSLITQKVKQDFTIAIKNGLAKGERNITNYKRTYPLMTRGRDLKFKYENEDIVINWVNKIKFKVVLGNGKTNKNKIELQHTLHKVINKEYKVGTSSLYFDKNNNLILNLVLDIPVKENNDFIEGRILGVDLGIKYPAYACLNDDTYKRKAIGCAEDFIKLRTQMKNRRQILQKQLVMVKGGKGRKNKTKALNRIKDKEKNFARTYNHMISKNIIEFAKKNKCGVIQLEKLTKDGFSNAILSTWSYYELQSFIEYKAKLEGIEVRYINPAYTSQTCSRCGHIDKQNRPTQEKFKCTKCEFELNADHNAAINIARSNNYVS